MEYADRRASSITSRIHEVVKRHPEIKLAYLFGSTVSGGKGPLGDYDVAISVDETNPLAMNETKLAVLADLVRDLETDAVDVVLLNTVESPEFAYEVIAKGKLIFEKEPYRLLVEPAVLNRYFDFRQSLKSHGLTKAL